MTETPTKTGRRQIGTVEITRQRIYPLDPQFPEQLGTATEVIVEPGTYPVFRHGMSAYWQMTGLLDHRHYHLGDGAFAMSMHGDVASEDEVTFYSRRYGPDEFAELLAYYTAEPEPRLIFAITDDPHAEEG